MKDIAATFDVTRQSANFLYNKIKNLFILPEQAARRGEGDSFSQLLGKLKNAFSLFADLE